MRQGERLAALLDALKEIGDHGLDVDCDGDCAQSMHATAIEGLQVFFGSDTWTFEDYESAREELRA